MCADDYRLMMNWLDLRVEVVGLPKRSLCGHRYRGFAGLRTQDATTVRTFTMSRRACALHRHYRDSVTFLWQTVDPFCKDPDDDVYV